MEKYLFQKLQRNSVNKFFTSMEKAMIIAMKMAMAMVIAIAIKMTNTN
jgi:hypothetical protein